MQFLTTVLLLVGLSSTYAAPAAPQEEFQADLKKALEPVQADVRALYDNAQTAGEDLVKAFSEAGNNILAAGRSLVSPVENMDRANVGEEFLTRAKNFGDQIQVNAKSLLDRINKDAQPLAANQRSAVVNVRDAVQGIESKYLTADGQDLIKTLSKSLLAGQ